MRISPTSLLRVEGGHRQVRLSYVVEDDGGSRKGLTVAGILPGATPISVGDDPTLARRAKVYVGEDEVGILDPHLSGDGEHPEDGEGVDRRLLTSGVLTCTFTLDGRIEVDPQFKPRTLFDAAAHDGYHGLEAHLLGEGAVGTMMDVLSFSEWGGRDVYPILRIARSDRDVATQRRMPRNGAAVLTPNGDLIGIVVSSFGDGRYYGVAPIRDALEWHRLRILSQQGRDRENPPKTRTQKPDPMDLSADIDSRLRKLMTV